MLIDSPRITALDRREWDRLERFDAALARSSRLDRIVEQAKAAVAAWADAGDGYVSVSWGKDSVVAADIALQERPNLPVKWVRSIDFETPECDQVRDAFLARHPDARYEEIPVVLRNPKRGEPGHDERRLDPNADHQDVLKECLTGRYVSGVRGEESKIRRISVGSRGLVTVNTCRPLGRWTAVDVFAYLHREGLPVHPLYAMSMGGAYDRRWLRTHPLCSALPPKIGRAREIIAWEDRYYGDVIAAAIAARAHMWTGRETS